MIEANDQHAPWWRTARGRATFAAAGVGSWTFLRVTTAWGWWG
jgi:hypothetical protein